jgi:hypothetical protein
MMWQAITVFEAQEQLRTLTCLDWPNMKKNQRQKLHKELYKLAYPAEIRNKNYISVQDLQRIVGR